MIEGDDDEEDEELPPDEAEIDFSALVPTKLPQSSTILTLARNKDNPNA